MLIIPMTGKLSRHNPPYVTLGLIFINFFVFFAFQLHDNRIVMEAMEFYFTSGLAPMELEAYLETKNTDGSHTRDLERLRQKKLKEDRAMALWDAMVHDSDFMSRLENDEIITPEDSRYEEWREQRTRYHEMMSKAVFMRYGFTPADPRLLTSLTYMFLHGGFMHLLMNMIFLWLAGCILELWCPRPFYLGLYLATGLVSVWFFYAVYPDSTTPLVGASGAVSGLIGAYTVAFGRTRIKIFYSLGFYFNYARVPAIVLLPVWLGNELFMLFFGGVSQVAYVAHVGGIISGALVALLNRRVLKWTVEVAVQEDPGERIRGLMEQGLKSLENLKMEEARGRFEEVLALEPNHRAALTNLFHIDKLSPSRERFHQTASRLFVNLLQDGGESERLYEVYQEYSGLSKQLRIGLDLLMKIASAFLAGGYLCEAETIMAKVLKRAPQHQRLPPALLNLGKGYLAAGDRGRAIRCLTVLVKKYGESPEARIARGLLKQAC